MIQDWERDPGTTFSTNYIQFEGVYSLTDYQICNVKRDPHHFSCYVDEFLEWIVQICVALVSVLVYWYVRRIGRQTVWTGRNYRRCEK